jgi:CheY-like chemotaxis protein
MPTVLVVDDSSVDRRLMGSLLTKNADLHVSFASNGNEALATMAGKLPDLVLTDLHMPEMSGFELVSAIIKQYPLVPVVLVTARGNEEIAVQALENGAASYVPKRALAQNLVETVYRVLSVSQQRRSRLRLLEGMNQFDCSFVLKNQSNLVPPLIEYLQDNLMHMGLCGEIERVRIGVALQEALANALCHGNLEVSSELRESDPLGYCAMLEERRQMMPYQARSVHVTARISRTEAVFVIRDEGPGFDISRVPDPTDYGNLDKASGRGMLLMRTFMSEVRYNDRGNQVTLVKRLEVA